MEGVQAAIQARGRSWAEGGVMPDPFLLARRTRLRSRRVWGMIQTIAPQSTCWGGSFWTSRAQAVRFKGGTRPKRSRRSCPCPKPTSTLDPTPTFLLAGAPSSSPLPNRPLRPIAPLRPIPCPYLFPISPRSSRRHPFLACDQRTTGPLDHTLDRDLVRVVGRPRLLEQSLAQRTRQTLIVWVGCRLRRQVGLHCLALTYGAFADLDPDLSPFFSLNSLLTRRSDGKRCTATTCTSFLATRLDSRNILADLKVLFPICAATVTRSVCKVGRTPTLIESLISPNSVRSFPFG
jgi:hypothetical protein